jgi:SOS-response transcriptional repressor LexA
MSSNREYIVRFIERSFEKSVDYYMLSDKKYIVPKQEVCDYINKVLAIPYYEFICFAKENRGIIEDDQLTQSSNFAACSSEMCQVMESQGNLGMRFVDIGQQFPQYIKQNNEVAYRKYGENQVKTAAQLGLTFEYYDYWYLTCVGYVYNDLNQQQQTALLARTVLRIPLYQDLLLRLLKEDVFLTEYMQHLAPSTKGRRTGSIMRLLNLCLSECRREGIRYHDLYYPIYVAKTKTIRMALSSGTALKVLNAYHMGCVPLYSLRAACGYFESGGIPEAEGWLDATGKGFTPDLKRHFVIHAKGDSMLPKIKDGDLCVFEWCYGEPMNGDITLTQCIDIDQDYGERYTIKRYYNKKTSSAYNNRIELHPLNPDYDTIVLEPNKDYRTVGIFKCVL